MELGERDPSVAPASGVRGQTAGRPRNRRRRTSRWVDFSVALAALVVSLASLLVARHQAQVMDRQLAASVWPAVQSQWANVGPTGELLIVHSLDNRGVGPARLASFRVAYHGVAIRNSDELAAACCRPDTTPAAAQPRLTVTRGSVVGRVAGAGEHVPWLTIRFDTTGAPAVRRATLAAYWAISRAADDIVVRVCYCSVLDECWVGTAAERRTTPVRSCAAEQKAPQYQ